jgi:PPP family 3-phenylpropionic acid transporter
VENRNTSSPKKVAWLPVFGTISSTPVINIGGMYLFYYMAIGAFMPFISLYYERLGLSGVQIGTLAALPVLVFSSTTLFWGGIADALHWHNKILRTALLTSPLAVFMLSRVDSFTALIPFVVTYAVFSSSIIPLLDSGALEVAKTHQRNYGDLRVWGTVGWSISSVLVGALVEKFSIQWLFFSYIVFMILTLLVSLFQPGRRQVLPTSLASGLKHLLIRRNFLIFLFSIFLLSVTLGAVNSFFSIYLDEIGAKEGIIGLGWALAAVSEVPVMLLSSAIMRHIGSSGLLKVAFITFALRWLLFSFIDTPTWALFVQLMHGLSFAAFLVGGVTYINERTPEGLGTTAQAIFNTATFGLGSIVGSLSGGYLYDLAGMMTLFRILSLVAIIGLAIFWLGNRSDRILSVKVAGAGEQ